MAWFSKKEKRENVENPQIPISNSAVVAFLTGSETTALSGEDVNQDTALQVPSIWGAVNFISSAIAALPLKVYKKSKEGREESTDRLAYCLHDAPNPEWTSYRWRKYSMTQTLLGGRSFTYIEKNRGGQVVNLWPMEPQRVTAKRSGGKTTYHYTENGKTTIYDAAEVIDIPFMLNQDQVNTVSPVHKLKDTIGLSLALNKYAARHFANGGVPPLVLQGPAMSPAAAARASEDIKAAIKRAAQGGDKAFAIPEGYELKSIGISPEDSQLEASRRFQIEEVSRIYSLPPVFLQDLTRATYSNAEQQDLHLVKHTLTAWLDSIEQEMNLKLFNGKGSRFVEFNVDGLLRGDFKTRMEGYASGVQNGLMTPNEVREKENRPPKDGGDNLYIQQNMSDMQKLGASQNGAAENED